MAKLVKCKHCGARIAATAKTCPQCGGENTPPKPAYKRLWFKILIALIVISFIQDLVNPRSTTTESAGSETVTSSFIAEKSEVDTASSVADSASEKEEDDADVRKFAKDNHISIELAENLNQVVHSIDLVSSVKKISNWNQTADWANGKRYNANVGFKDIQVSVIGDEVYCIKDMTHNKTDNFIYRKEGYTLSGVCETASASTGAVERNTGTGVRFVLLYAPVLSVRDQNQSGLPDFQPD